MLKKIKGTQDISFDELKYWYFIEKAIKKVTNLFCFKEIRTPMFEATELFKRSVGEATDVVQKEMYTFEDKGKRSITLRPEGTAPVARAFVENGFMNYGLPLKLYYTGSMFRYEKPQAGRLREFHQFGAEIIGSKDFLADFEIIELAINFLDELRINDYKIYINSIGCKKCRTDYIEALKNYYADKKDQLCEDCKKRYDQNILRLLDCKEDREISKDAPSILDYLCDECKNDFDNLKKLLESRNIEFSVDKNLVRGLDYYSKTAFEFRSDKLGAQDQILGGGRYDGLIDYIGNKSVPAVGFACGIERIIILLKELEYDIEFDSNPKVAILPFEGSRAFNKAFDYAERLRRRNIETYVDVINRNMKNKLKHANRIGVKLSVIIGEDELSNNILSIKEMKDGTQFNVEESWMEHIIEDKLNKI